MFPNCESLFPGFPEGSRREEVVRFLEAATLMKGIQHRHIVPVLRVSVEDNAVPLVVYPMVQYGDMYRIMKVAADPEHSVLPVSWVYYRLTHSNYGQAHVCEPHSMPHTLIIIQGSQ